uniref:Uncharacterized protein n=1 Tax=viral metagenome TaxID=1070528 RepID=A0A6M3IJV5_9ZZZZ
MKKISLILMVMILMCSCAYGQQFTKETKFAIGVGLQDMYDVVKGDANIGAIIQFAPIFPLNRDDDNLLCNVYMMPFIRGGYDNQWESTLGGGVAYDFDRYYIRYGMEVVELTENKSLSTDISNEVGFGFSMSKLLGWSFLENSYLDILYRVNTEAVDLKQKEEIKLTFVKIL